MNGQALTRLWRWILCAAALAVAQAVTAASLAPDLADTIARLETNRAEVSALDARIATLQQRISRLQSDPVANAAALSSAESTLALREDERSAAAAKVESLAAQLLDLRERFVDRTGVAKADLAAQVSALRDLEAARAGLQQQIATIQARLAKLHANPAKNAAEIADATARLDTKKTELEAKRAAIASARSSLASLELAAIGGGGTAVLNWSIPTTRADGSPLAPGELAGYEIYVLAESTGDTSVIPVNDPLATTYTVSGLVPDTYHFSMAAIDADGNPSELSDLVSKTVAP